MTAQTFSVFPKCKSNEDCMRLFVDDPNAASQLAEVWPILAETGGHDGVLLDPQRGEVLDFSTRDYNDGHDRYKRSWFVSIWHESDQYRTIDVIITTEWTGDEWLLRTTTEGPTLVGSVETCRTIGGKSYRSKRPNVRREAAKALANYLNAKCSAEAVAAREEERLEMAAYNLKRLEQSTLRLLAVMEASGSSRTEDEVRAILSDTLERFGAIKTRCAIDAKITKIRIESNSDAVENAILRCYNN